MVTSGHWVHEEPSETEGCPRYVKSSVWEVHDPLWVQAEGWPTVWGVQLIHCDIIIFPRQILQLYKNTHAILMAISYFIVTHVQASVRVFQVSKGI